MTTTSTASISDLTKSSSSYTCLVTSGTISARATVTRQGLRPFNGAYELTVSASNGSRRPMGTRQREIADGLVLEAKGELARALEGAGWSSEQRLYGGKELVLWCPPPAPVEARQPEAPCTPDAPCWQHEPCAAHSELATQTLRESTESTAPAITHRIAYDSTTRDYACYVSVGGDPEQYIGSAATYHAGELRCCDYRNDLLDSALGIDSRPTPRCGDCGAALADTGRCEDRDDRASVAVPVCPTCRRAIGQRIYDPHTGVCLDCQEQAVSISEPEPCKGLSEDRKYYAVTVGGNLYRLHNEWSYGIDFREARLGLPDIWVGRDLDGDEPTNLPVAARARVRALWERLFAAEPIEEHAAPAAPAVVYARPAEEAEPIAESHDDTQQDAEEIRAAAGAEQASDTRLFCSRCGQCELFLKDGLCAECLPATERPRSLTFHPGGAFRMSTPSWGS